ncbi:MAG: purine phosphorylase [Rhodospirillales bacterium]
MVRLGIVTGLASEVGCLGTVGAGARVVCAAADPGRADRAVRDLLARGCRGLISFGIAGGLDPGVAVGTPILAATVVTPDGRRLPTDAAWRERVRTRLASDVVAIGGDLVGSDHVVGDEAAKRRLREASGAAAVDMESHVVASAAAACAVPFVVIRVVSDGAGDVIPAWVPATIRPDGRPATAAVLRGLLARPGDLPNLVRLRANSRRALVTLRRVAARAGPLFCLDG